MRQMNNEAGYDASRTSHSGRLLVIGGALMLLSHAASATSWYVDGRNGKQSNPGSAAAPFQYFWQGTQVAKPGDTVYVLPSVVYPHMSISVSGTSSQPITFAGAGLAPNLTRVVGDTSNFAMWVNANYVVIKNFDFTAPGVESALHIAENHHHVTIANNVAHDAGGNGISTVGDDYITISHNIVYGNAKNTSNNVFGSGISTLGSIDIDSATGVKMRIDGNVVYANTNTPNCTVASCLATATDSDGNGIIVDDSRRIQRDHIPYHGRTLITNNVVFGNGGRGVHIYLSDHVTVTNNTVYWNNQDPYEGKGRTFESCVSANIINVLTCVSIPRRTVWLPVGNPSVETRGDRMLCHNRVRLYPSRRDLVRAISRQYRSTVLRPLRPGQGRGRAARLPLIADRQPRRWRRLPRPWCRSLPTPPGLAMRICRPAENASSR